VGEAVEPVRRTVDDAVGPVRETTRDAVQPVAETVEPVRSMAGPLVKPVTETVNPVVETVKPLTDHVVEPLTRTAEPVVGIVEPGASTPEESVQTAPEPAAIPPVGPGSVLEPTVMLDPVVGDEPVGVAASLAFELASTAASVAVEPRLQNTAVQSTSALPLPEPATALAAVRSTAPYPVPRVEKSTTVGLHLSTADPSLGNLRGLLDRTLVGESLASFGSFVAGSVPHRMPSPFSLMPATVGSAAGLSSGFGGGVGLGILALLFALSPPGGRLLRAFCDFRRPSSALRLVPELPG